jgi:Ser/Thr protein kinase RdoA (MazF antagonist)
VVALHGKPAAIVSKLEGSSQMDPQPVHCAEVGAMLARMHLAGADFPLRQPNLRGLDWWNETVPQGAALPRRRQGRPAGRNWPSSASLPPAPPTSGCKQGPCTPTCSATT